MLKSFKNKIVFLPAVLVMVVFMLSKIPAFGATEDWKLEFSNNEVAADIQDAPLIEILEEIQEKEGIEFLLDKGEFDRAITVKFGFLPLEEAIARIVGVLNHAIMFGADDKILKVTIIGTGWASPLSNEQFLTDAQLRGSQMDTENLSKVTTEVQVTSEDHEMVEKSSSIAVEMPIESPNLPPIEMVPPSDTDMTVIESPS